MKADSQISHHVAVLAGDVFKMLVNDGGALSIEAILSRRAHFLPESSRRDDPKYVRGKVVRAANLLTHAGIIQRRDGSSWAVLAKTQSREQPRELAIAISMEMVSQFGSARLSNTPASESTGKKPNTGAKSSHG